MRVRPVFIPLLAAGLPAATAFHLRLVRALPAADSTVARPPAAVELWFSQRAEAAVTRVRVVDSAGRAVALGPLAASDTRVTAPVRASLPAGPYRVEWRTMAGDGHAVTGRFSFRVAPAGR